LLVFFDDGPFNGVMESIHFGGYVFDGVVRTFTLLGAVDCRVMEPNGDFDDWIQGTIDVFEHVGLYIKGWGTDVYYGGDDFYPTAVSYANCLWGEWPVVEVEWIFGDNLSFSDEIYMEVYLYNSIVYANDCDQYLFYNAHHFDDEYEMSIFQNQHAVELLRYVTDERFPFEYVDDFHIPYAVDMVSYFSWDDEEEAGDMGTNVYTLSVSPAEVDYYPNSDYIIDFDCTSDDPYPDSWNIIVYDSYGAICSPFPKEYTYGGQDQPHIYSDYPLGTYSCYMYDYGSSPLEYPNYELVSFDVVARPVPDEPDYFFIQNLTGQPYCEGDICPYDFLASEGTDYYFTVWEMHGYSDDIERWNDTITGNGTWDHGSWLCPYVGSDAAWRVLVYNVTTGYVVDDFPIVLVEVDADCGESVVPGLCVREIEIVVGDHNYFGFVRPDDGANWDILVGFDNDSVVVFHLGVDLQEDCSSDRYGLVFDVAGEYNVRLIRDYDFDSPVVEIFFVVVPVDVVDPDDPFGEDADTFAGLSIGVWYILIGSGIVLFCACLPLIIFKSTDSIVIVFFGLVGLGIAIVLGLFQIWIAFLVALVAVVWFVYKIMGS